MDLHDIADSLHTAARSIGAEITSPWLYLQLGLILTGAGLAFGTGAAVRSRVEMTSLAMGWPAPLRLGPIAATRTSDSPARSFADAMSFALVCTGRTPAGNSPPDRVIPVTS